ncbi:MAG: IS1595 family transposase [Gemmatimonadota bacterium]
MPKTNRKDPKRAASSESDYSIMEFMREFPDDDACLEWLWRTRHSPDGEHAHCPKCEAEREFRKYETKQQRQSWTCTGCGLHIHPTAGTIFHKSSTSLHLWFYAIYLMTSTRCGISAKQLEREIGVTYKTAWRMMNLIRTKLMAQDDTKLSGDVEADETYVGGRPRYRRRLHQQHGRSGRGTTKAPVFGMVERGGKVIALHVPNVKRSSLLGHMSERVLPKSTVYTDELSVYDGILPQRYEHKRIYHSAKVYVMGDVHTNTIEGFFSLVKRGLGGVYHSVSTKHLQSYLSEYAWRYNHRNGEAQFRALVLLAALTPA